VYSRELMGEERYNKINEKRKLKISLNSNKEGCRNGQRLGVESRRKNGTKWSVYAKGRTSEKYKGRVPWNKGLTKLTDARIKKLADSKTIHHEKINRKDYGWTLELRQKIRTRDNWCCTKCGKNQHHLRWVLCIHHIDLNPKNNSEDNLISMCRACHNAFHSSLFPKRKKF
jgi:hypothetical protein